MQKSISFFSVCGGKLLVRYAVAKKAVFLAVVQGVSSLIDTYCARELCSGKKVADDSSL